MIIHGEGFQSYVIWERYSTHIHWIHMHYETGSHDKSHSDFCILRTMCMSSCKYLGISKTCVC